METMIRRCYSKRNWNSGTCLTFTFLPSLYITAYSLNLYLHQPVLVLILLTLISFNDISIARVPNIRTRHDEMFRLLCSIFYSQDPHCTGLFCSGAAALLSVTILIRSFRWGLRLMELAHWTVAYISSSKMIV